MLLFLSLLIKATLGAGADLAERMHHQVLPMPGVACVWHSCRDEITSRMFCGLTMHVGHGDPWLFQLELVTPLALSVNEAQVSFQVWNSTVSGPVRALLSTSWVSLLATLPPVVRSRRQPAHAA